MPADRPGNASWDGPYDIDDGSSTAALKLPSSGGNGPRRPPRPVQPDRSDVGGDRHRRFGIRNMVVDRGTERASGPVDRVVVPPASTGQDDTAVTTRPDTGPSRNGAPVRKPNRRAEPVPSRRRGRRVRRIIRRIDLWSVLKLSLVLYSCIYVAVLATLAVLWGLAYSSGSVDRLQKFLGDVGLENYHFYGGQMFRACAAIGAIVVIAGTVITVLATALVNVISELTGGIRVIVIEEDVQPR